MEFLIVFVGLFCDAIEKGERAQFTDFDRRKSKNGSNIDARADIVALSGDFFDQRINQFCQNCDIEKCDAANCDVTDVIWQTPFGKRHFRKINLTSRPDRLLDQNSHNPRVPMSNQHTYVLGLKYL
jgi:hypothetical protein